MPIKRAFVAVAVLALFSIGWAAERADVGKRDIEVPIEKTVKNLAALSGKVNLDRKVKQPQKPKLDLEKGFIERGTKQLLVNGKSQHAESATAPTAAAMIPENPKVEPGKVRWHADFAAACAAARESRKPVLLFQMMGNLDDRFC